MFVICRKALLKLALLCFSLYLRAISKYKPPGAYIQRGLLTEGFLLYKFGQLIYGGPYTWTMGLFFKILWYMESFLSCWFSPLLREVFLQVLRFPPLLKNQHNLNSSSTRNQVDEEPLCGYATSKSGPLCFNVTGLYVGILGFKFPAIHKPLILQACCIACLYSLRYSSPMLQMLLLFHMARKQNLVFIHAITLQSTPSKPKFYSRIQAVLQTTPQL